MADAPASGAGVRKGVRVQVPPRAHATRPGPKRPGLAAFAHREVGLDHMISSRNSQRSLTKIGLNEPMGEPRHTVLVVEDDEPIRDLVTLALSYEGHDVTACATGRAASDLLRDRVFDLVVLDVMLPDLDGFELLHRIRSHRSSTATMFLTARDEVDSRVRALRGGADDYLVKPFSVDELVARVEAVLRRTQGAAGASVMTVGELVFDDSSHEVRRAGERVDLTPTEYKLLRCLMRHAGQALSKQQILDQVWEYDFDGASNVVEIYISYLRRKLDRDGVSMIHTIRGYGYTLRLPD
jgi:two-component system, OmpR family, response regulator